MRGGRLSIGLLGGFELRDADGTPLPTPSAAARSLIAFVALHPDRLLSRDLVAGRLWPDESNDAARANLRQALFAAKEAAGVDPFVRPAGSIGLDRDRVRVDVDDFLDAIDHAAKATDADERLIHLETAVDRYRGDLMEGFYEGPTDIQAGALRRQYVGALERLVDLHIASRREDSALVLARRLVRADPWIEQSHRKVMWLAATTGRFHEAIRQYQECVKVLDEELGTEPSFETVDLHDSIVRERETGRLRAFAPDLPLVGRDRERASVAAALDALATGVGTVVLVEGDTGMGKTRLLDTISADATWRMIDVRAMRGLPDSPPYGAVLPALDSLDPADLADLDDATRRRIAGLRAPIEPGPAHFDDHAAMHDAVARALVASSTLPATVIVDDAHELDGASAGVVARLADLTTERPFVLVVAYRHDAARRNDVWETIVAIDRIPRRVRISLGPLSAGQTESLARAVAGHEIAPDAAADLHGATGGVPFLVVEAMRDPTSQPSSEPLGDAVRSVTSAFLRHRTSDLDPDARRTLDLLALVGRPAGPDLVRGLGGSGLRELTARGLVSLRDGDAEIANDLARELIVASLPAADAVELHRHLAATLEDVAPDDADAIARHLVAAGEAERAAPYLIEAAERALAVHEYRDSLIRLRDAAEALPDGDPALLDVRRRIYEILDLLGERDAQDEALGQYEEVADGLDAIDAMRLRARWLADGDDFGTARKMAREALDLARRADDPGREVAALTTLAWIECLAGDAVRGAALLDEASGFGGVGAREQADARNALGQNLVDLQRYEEAETQLLAAKALYADLNELRGEIEVVGMLAAIHMHRGATDRAIETFEWAVDRSREIGYREGEAKNLANLGVALVMAPDPIEGASLLREAADRFRTLRDRRREAQVLLNLSWIEHATLADHAAALRHSQAAQSYFSAPKASRFRAQAMVIEGAARAAMGQPKLGQDRIRLAINELERASDLWLEAQAWRELATIQLIDGDLSSSIDSARICRERCRKGQLKDILAGAAAIEVLAGSRSGISPEADVVADLNGSTGGDLKHVVFFARSEHLRDQGDSREADQVLADAVESIDSVLASLDDEARTRVLTSSPFAQEIHTKWAERRPLFTSSLVSSADAPPRGATRPGDLIEVRWMSHHPDDKALGKVARRRARILRLQEAARESGAIASIPQIARIFEVSESTATRDARALNREVHGFRTRGMVSDRKDEGEIQRTATQTE